MPELPDLTVVADALHAALAGRAVVSASAPGPLAVRGTPAELEALVGQRVESIRRRGKFLLIELERDAIACQPDADRAVPAGRAGRQAAGQDGGRPGASAARGAGPAGCGRAGRAAPPGCPPTTREPEVRYRDPTQMGKVYLRPAGVDRPVPGLGEPEQGPDADDPALTLEVWRERIRRHPGELKNLLRNQSFVAGIGNAYSDEILHAARLLPFRKRSSLAPEEVDALYAATRTTLADAIAVLRERVPPTFERQVRDFLAVHDKGGQACPRCGTRITEVKAGGFITSYCRGCQR